jgi:Flp pilus assembly protein TadB
MGLILVLLLIAVILAGVGFAIHILWIIAAVFFIAWLVGLVLGAGRKSNT